MILLWRATNDKKRYFIVKSLNLNTSSSIVELLNITYLLIYRKKQRPALGLPVKAGD